MSIFWVCFARSIAQSAFDILHTSVTIQLTALGRGWDALSSRQPGKGHLVLQEANAMSGAAENGCAEPHGVDSSLLQSPVFSTALRRK